MIQSRKNLIEDAFYKATGSSTKVLLIQQKDSLSNNKKEDKMYKKTQKHIHNIYENTWEYMEIHGNT